MRRDDGAAGPSGLSRRGFLKGLGAGAALVTATPARGSPAPIGTVSSAQQKTKVIGPGAVEATLNVNGVDRKVSVEPRVTLLDALRNRLDVTGAKKVCDRATCGACTVLVDNRPVYSCTMLALEAEGRKIETVESLGSPDALSPIQQAVWECDGQQCGFCTPGFVLACTAELRRNPHPSREEALDALSGNLCRCGTYVGLKAAMSRFEAVQKGGK